MQKLNIKTPEREITIDLSQGDLSIVVGNEAANDAPTTPKLEWSHTLLNGKEVTFAEAEKAASALGEGWRLPTRQELESILDLSRHDPAIDTAKFPDAKSAYYWTSSKCAWNESARWVVGFGYGSVSGYDVSLDACVRAVRAGQ